MRERVIEMTFFAIVILCVYPFRLHSDESGEDLRQKENIAQNDKFLFNATMVSTRFIYIAFPQLCKDVIKVVCFKIIVCGKGFSSYVTVSRWPVCHKFTTHTYNSSSPDNYMIAFLIQFNSGWVFTAIGFLPTYTI